MCNVKYIKSILYFSIQTRQPLYHELLSNEIKKCRFVKFRSICIWKMFNKKGTRIDLFVFFEKLQNKQRSRRNRMLMLFIRGASKATASD